MKLVNSFERKNYKLILVLIVVVLAIPVAVLLANEEVVNYLTRATIEKGPAYLALMPKGQTKFSRLPVQMSVRADDELELILALDTGGKSVRAAKVAIKYDRDKLRLLGNTVESGVVFNRFLSRDIDNLEGLIKLEFTGDYIGVGRVAYLGFQVLPQATGQAVVEVVSDPQYLDDSKVIGAETGNDILGGANSVTVVVSEVGTGN